MNIDLGTGLAVLGIAFTAGTMVALLRQNARQGAALASQATKHGTRLGELGTDLATLRGEVDGYQRGFQRGAASRIRTRAKGVPVIEDSET